MPLSGGPAAAAFAPVAAGFQAYIDYANENELVPGYELALTIGDDQYDPAMTPNVVNGALDAGAHLFSGIIGTPNNEAVRDLLNEECIPQLQALTGSPAWGEVADYPWTTGALMPYDLETEMYVADIVKEFPDGATAAVFYTNNDFGAIYNEDLRGARRRQQHRDRRHPDDRSAGDRSAAGPDQQHRRQRAGRDHGCTARSPVRDVRQRAGQRQGGQPRLGATWCTSPTRAPAR